MLDEILGFGIIGFTFGIVFTLIFALIIENIVSKFKVRKLLLNQTLILKSIDVGPIFVKIEVFNDLLKPKIFYMQMRNIDYCNDISLMQRSRANLSKKKIGYHLQIWGDN